MFKISLHALAMPSEVYRNNDMEELILSSCQHGNFEITPSYLCVHMGASKVVPNLSFLQKKI